MTAHRGGLLHLSHLLFNGNFVGAFQPRIALLLKRYIKDFETPLGDFLAWCVCHLQKMGENGWKCRIYRVRGLRPVLSKSSAFMLLEDKTIKHVRPGTR